ncbi:MAG: hypothetical protein GY765_28385, partial [bacterium]|nr:hypothetical protein [bacterium]
MFKNYLLSAFRNLKKAKLFSLINVMGLSIGFATCLLIVHYVAFERSYDKFYENSERIYRLRYERITSDGTSARFASCTPSAAIRIRGRFPDVEKIARIYRSGSFVYVRDCKPVKERMYYAEPEFFDIFKLKFKKLAPGLARGGGIGLKLNQAFLSLSTAKKYFGTQNPIGQTFKVGTRYSYKVVGVFEDIPANSHLKFDVLLSFKNLETAINFSVAVGWWKTGFYTYLLVKPGTDMETLKKKLADLVSKEGGGLKSLNMEMTLPLQPLEDIHLNSHYMHEYELNGSRNSVNVLFIIAFFIVIIAWLNYINLSTVYFLTRTREIALRKVMGASPKQLMALFFVEIVLLNSIAVFFALVPVELSLFYFNTITGIPMEYGIWSTPWFPPVIAGMFLIGIFLAGLYPAFATTSFTATGTLKRLPGLSGKNIILRRTIVVFQFVIARVLVTATLGVYSQLDFMKKHDTGFDMEQVIVVKIPRLRAERHNNAVAAFKDALTRDAAVKKVCVSSEVPGRRISWDAGGIRKVGDGI